MGIMKKIKKSAIKKAKKSVGLPANQKVKTSIKKKSKKAIINLFKP
jgi:hypothetical protein